MGSVIPYDEELTYDTPSAFLEAMEYSDNNFTNLNMLQLSQGRQSIKQRAADPSLGQQYRTLNLNSNKWTNHASINNLELLNNYSMSPLDATFSADTGYGSNEASSEKSPPALLVNTYEISGRTNPTESNNDTSKPRKRSKASASTATSKQEPKPAARKARRASKAASIDAEDLDGMDDTKREQFLARNREAASKCRQKKKQWTSNLEERARELSFEKQMLTTQAAMLKNELLMLKCKCLEHSNCNCEAIRDYLKHTVTNLPPANAALYSRADEEEASSRKSSVFSHASRSGAVTSPESAGEDLEFLVE